MKNVQLNRPITMCIAQFNLYLVVLVVAILPTTRPAIASHNLARFNSGINPGIPGLSKLNPEIPGLAKRSGIAFPISIFIEIRCPNLNTVLKVRSSVCRVQCEKHFFVQSVESSFDHAKHRHSLCCCRIRLFTPLHFVCNQNSEISFFFCFAPLTPIRYQAVGKW